MRITGVIRRWIPSGGWGICNSYPSGNDVPQKYFVHISKAPEGTELDLGVRISFTPGPPRRKGDLPAALDIQIVPARTFTNGGVL